MLLKNNSGVIFVLTGILLLLISFFLNVMSEALYNTAIEQNREIDVIAHRGLPFEAPENSLEGIEKAIEKKCKFIEIDVHQTSDGAIVLLHDFTLDRTTKLTGLIKNHSLSQIEEYNTKVKNGMIENGVKLPLLNEVLELVNGRANVIVEVKSGGSFYPNIELQVADIINRHHAHSWVQVHSFSDEVLENVHAADSKIELHKLMVFYWPLINLMVDEGVHFRKLKSYDFVSRFSIFYPFANRRLIKRMHNLNKKVNIWSLNNHLRAKNYIGLGVDGIITDRADDFLTNPLIVNPSN